MGTVLIDDSIWGHVAGKALIGNPLYWISLYALYAYFFRSNGWYLLLSVLVSATIGHQHLRFIFQPFVIIAFAALIDKGTWKRGWLFVFLLAFQAIVTPESGFTVIAFGFVLVLYEAYYRTRGASLRNNFPRMFHCLIGGTAFLALFFGYLIAHHAFDDFLFYYWTFVPGHSYTGAVPLVEPVIIRWMFLPVAAIYLAFWHTVAKWRARADFTSIDAVILALAVMVAFYFQKFVARADGHVFHVTAVAIPLCFLIGYVALERADQGVFRFFQRMGRKASPKRVVSASLLFLSLFTFPQFKVWATRLHFLPLYYVQEVAEPARDSRIGYSAPEVFLGWDPKVVNALKETVSLILEPGEALFDFSNQPLLSHYLLDTVPATRYFYVSMAIRRRTQVDLVRQLAANEPKLVLYFGSAGLSKWDNIPNMVRHYEISKYILQHYEPLTMNYGNLLMVRKEDFQDVISDPLIQKNLRSTRGRITGWARDSENKAPASKVVAWKDGKVLTAVSVKGGQYPNSFTLYMQWPEKVPMSGIRIYGISRSGEASELSYGKSAFSPSPETPAATEIRLSEHEVYPVRAGATEGWVDTTDYSLAKYLPAYFDSCDWGFADEYMPEPELPDTAVTVVPEPVVGHPGLYRLDVREPSAFGWIEVSFQGKMGENHIMISDQPAMPSIRVIQFGTLPGKGNVKLVMINNCYQLFQYLGDDLYLKHRGPNAIETVRLFPAAP